MLAGLARLPELLGGLLSEAGLAGDALDREGRASDGTRLLLARHHDGEDDAADDEDDDQADADPQERQAGRVLALGVERAVLLHEVGYIARKYNLITDFGKIMDPLADKILVISALVIFVQLEYIPGWMSIIVLAREFLISGIRILAAAKGEIIAAGNLGK